MKPVLSVTGVVDDLLVYEDRIVKQPRSGAMGFLTGMGKGTKSIPYGSISAIQMKEANLLSNGFLEFTISGGSEKSSPGVKKTDDENVFIFRGKNNEIVKQVHDFVTQKISDKGKPAQTVIMQSNNSLADELQKLVSLKEQGLLSEEEFASAKAKLIS